MDRKGSRQHNALNAIEASRHIYPEEQLLDPRVQKLDTSRYNFCTGNVCQRRGRNRQICERSLKGTGSVGNECYGGGIGRLR